MKVLVLRNHPLEGPGTMEDFFRMHSISYRIVEAGLGEKIPALEEYSHLVVLGGPMGVYERDKYQFLKEVALAIERALKDGIRVLGICLGAQLFAHVLGSKAYPGKAKEIGWLSIRATQEGIKDEVFRNILDPSGSAIVFQWHGDTYDLPSEATRLAFSDLYSEQAFRYQNSYALQFHIEVSLQMVREWFEGSDLLESMLKEGKDLYFDYRSKAMLFYRSFFM